MRSLSFILATLVGIACWAITAAFSGGVAPLGDVGPTEGLVFFTPIALFALPLAVIAFVRGRSLAGLWICALAPILGAANFAASMSQFIRDRPSGGAVTEELSTYAMVWCVLLLLVLAVSVIRRRSARHMPAE